MATDQELLKMKRDLEALEKAATRAETELELAEKRMKSLFGHTDQEKAGKEIQDKETELDTLERELDQDKESIQNNFRDLLALTR